MTRPPGRGSPASSASRPPPRWRARPSLRPAHGRAPALPAISVPTLVLHRTGDPLIDIAHGRYLAEHIRGARFVELPGDDHIFSASARTRCSSTRSRSSSPGRARSTRSTGCSTTVLFTDIVGSTERAAASATDAGARARCPRRAVRARAGALPRPRGQDRSATGSWPPSTDPRERSAARWRSRDSAARIGIDVRAGLHTGECELRGDDLAGIAVHIGARVAALARPGEVLVTSTVRDLVAGSGIEFADRGRHALKGIPGEWQLLAATP